VRDGELDQPKLPLALGHQIVGEVIEVGSAVRGFKIGDRLGVPWLAWTCGECKQCRAGRENLCERALFTGYTVDGGFTEETVANAAYCFPLPAEYSAAEAAPLLCGGLIGYRALRLAGEGERIGLYGFGSAAHLIAQVVRHQGRRVFAFTRAGDTKGQDFARSCGAEWAGSASELPPEPLDAAILFAPAGEHVPAALAAVGPGGTVVCAGIHMSDIPSFPYRLLWEERVVRSVANLERRDGSEFLALASRFKIATQVTRYPLEEAEKALADLRAGRFEGSAVLEVGER
jgi:propanol-preferring alcohol dehydrogenase